ncbi:MAG: hypothetical protein ACR2K6_10030 [Solirubrobacterales bacterium]
MASNAPELIKTAYGQFVAELPALAKLNLVIRVELHGRGDVQIFRVQTPGPEISKTDPGDARLTIDMPRAVLNEHASGTVSGWHKPWDHGEIKVGGDPDIAKLLGTVIAKHEARAGHRRVR